MKKEYEVTGQGWTGGFFPSPEGLMHSKYADEVEVTNITSMAYPELDALIEEYNAEWDAKKRVPLAHKLIVLLSIHSIMRLVGLLPMELECFIGINLKCLNQALHM